MARDGAVELVGTDSRGLCMPCFVSYHVDPGELSQLGSSMVGVMFRTTPLLAAWISLVCEGRDDI